MRSRTRLAIAAIGTAGVVIAALVWFGPFLTRERAVISATPGPPPLFQTTVVPLPGGATACIGQVDFDTNSELAQFRVGTNGRPGPPLSVRADGPGWSSRNRVTGFKDNALLSVPLRPPPHSLIGRLCIANSGRRPIALYASSESRTRSREVVTVAGKPVGPSVTLALLQRKRQSIGARVPAVMRHAAALNPPLAPALVWLVALLALIAIPGGLIGALLLAPQTEDGEQERREEDLQPDDHERSREDREALL